MADTSNIKDKLKAYHDSMIQTLETLKIDDLKTTTVTIRLGNKIYDLVASKESVIVDEDQIRKEFEDKLTEKRLNIRDTIKAKMSEVSALVSSIQSEYERKEKILKDTMSKAAPMPEVTWSHAQRGLSIVKGGSRGEIIWIVKRTYNPKFMDHKSIEPLYVKKLMTHIYIRITTRDNAVMGVSSHYMNNMDYFDHYHQARPDCWGNWKYPKSWNTADDIIKIADDATSVMENINTMSVAHRTPSLMPRLETLRRHLAKDPIAPPVVKVGVSDMREGLGMNAPNSDIWGN